MWETIKNHEFWTWSYLGNSSEQYVIALGIFIAVIIAFLFIKKVLLKFLAKLAKKTHSDFDDTLVHVLKSITPAFYLYVAIYCGSQMLFVSSQIRQVMWWVLLVWIILRVCVATQFVIDYMGRQYRRKTKANPTAVGLVTTLLKLTLWVIGGIMILSNLGVDVTSLIAGLGIGGIAIALAVQNVLGDLFSYFTIHFDKPFKEGDVLSVGGVVGTVEKVGVKTTRLKALSGEEIVYPNKDLTGQAVNNLKRMSERRVMFHIGVTYQTSAKLLKEIPEMIRKIIENTADVRVGRIHFAAYAASSLDYEIVYFVESPDYDLYMDRNQEILFAIHDVFEKKKIEFAYPTQTVFVEKA